MLILTVLGCKDIVQEKQIPTEPNVSIVITTNQGYKNVGTSGNTVDKTQSTFGYCSCAKLNLNETTSSRPNNSIVLFMILLNYNFSL
ncbi:hypothetical protein [Algibacter mikhailovii]|uniref:hypothetical protein n=1 Tax=Algibacter mikhailovii TaxID=425498 RepID=UPI00167A9DAA|nr:hypothetical protein [Algibacter mikhailovii]